jgi:hypothetical protein
MRYWCDTLFDGRCFCTWARKWDPAGVGLAADVFGIRWSGKGPRGLGGVFVWEGGG